MVVLLQRLFEWEGAEADRPGTAAHHLAGKEGVGPKLEVAVLCKRDSVDVAKPPCVSLTHLVLQKRSLLRHIR